MKKFGSGAVRDHEEQARFDLIPVESLHRLALIYGEGAKKYGDRNWKKGLPTADVLNHAFMHYTEWRKGNTDEDHLAKIAWAMFTLIWNEEHDIH